MKLKVYNQIQYESDSKAQFFYNNVLKNQFSEETICYYEEPDYNTDSGILPTFTVLDKEKGLYNFIVFDYNDEVLTEIQNNYWVIQGKKSENKLLHFADFVYKFESEINMPTNGLDNKVNIKKVACFININKSSFKLPASFKDIEIIGDDYRTYQIEDAISTSLTDDEFTMINSVIHKTDILKKDKGYVVEQPIDNMRDAIAYNNQGINIFDDEQLDASLSITNSSEKIRGLAGTGKTVILAIKAARLHKKYPDKKILYTFSTHSLYNQVTRLVNKYYYKIMGEYPNDNLKIMHAWGGKRAGQGVYYNACIDNGILPKTVSDARGKGKDAFDYVCDDILKHKIKESYDFILLDEAQDMPKSFFCLLEKLTYKPSKIIYAYDELQNINNTFLPEAEELFGKNDDNTPKIKIDKKHNHVLKKTYRNHKNVLLTAFGFGFGFYSNSGLTQILNKQETWEALGFEIDGKLHSGNQITVTRNLENSPNSIDKIYDKQEIITFNTFKTMKDELNFVFDEIKKLLEIEMVKPEDIMVIDMSVSSSKRLKYLQSELYLKCNTESTIPGIVDGARDFLIEDSVTLTTVRKAKGNEVPIVFVIGLDRIYDHKNEYEKRQLRNMTFVSLTRAKAWLYLTGSGQNSEELEEEYRKLHDDISSKSGISFRFPTDSELLSIQKINVLTNDANVVQNIEKSVKTLQDLAGEDTLEYLNLLLDDETKNKLLRALKQNEGE
ncbi:DEAD/DEAH box helicase [Lactococcus lactis]|uniref:DEAD/DEAH box helicase n=1 Tax=Lactococcus lactis TaxID=1358 RepID=UPI003D184549